MMEDNKSVIKGEFDRTGQYDAGLKSLVRALRWAFYFLLVTIIGLMVYFLTAGGYFSVEPQQSVIVMRFGEIIGTDRPEGPVYTSGGYWFFPYPVHRWVTIRTNQQSIQVDFLPADRPDGAPPQALVPGRDAYLLTGDANIIHASWRVNYQVINPISYYTLLATPEDPTADDTREIDQNGFIGTRGPQTLLRNLFREAVIRTTATFKVDDMLYRGRANYSDAVLAEFRKLVAEANCGVEVNIITLDQLFPPLKTKPAFDEVSAASNTVDSMRSQAGQYAVQAQNEAIAESNRLIADATTYQTLVVSEVKSESTYFSSILTEYQKNPAVLMTLYTNTLAEVLRDQQGKYILGTTGNGFKQVRIQLNPEPKRRAPSAANAEEN